MTEKRFTQSGRWIKDNYIDKLLNIDFNTITDSILCCELLNQIEDEKKRNGKIATKYLKENEQLKFELNECKEHKLFSRRQLEEENEQLKQQLDNVDDCLTRNDIKMLKAERGFE